MKTQLIAPFSDGEMQYRFRIEAESLKRQPNENWKSYIHRKKRLVDKGWPTPSNADADAQTACENQRNGKYKYFFIRSLTPPGFNKKARQALFEDPNKTWDALETLIINKDSSLVNSAELYGRQQSTSRTLGDSTDARFTNIEKSLNEISNMTENHQMNVTYDLNNPKMEQDYTRFCTCCKKFGSQNFVGHPKKKLTQEKVSLQPKKLVHKITQTDKTCQIPTDRIETITLTPKEAMPTAHTL